VYYAATANCLLSRSCFDIRAGWRRQTVHCDITLFATSTNTYYVVMFHIEFSVQMTMTKWLNHCWYEVLLQSHPTVQLSPYCGLGAERRVWHVPRQNSTFGDRSFAAAGPRTWNKLPFSLRDTGLSLTTFNERLKTYTYSPSRFETTAHL